MITNIDELIFLFLFLGIPRVSLYIRKLILFEGHQGGIEAFLGVQLGRDEGLGEMTLSRLQIHVVFAHSHPNASTCMPETLDGLL